MKYKDLNLNEATDVSPYLTPNQSSEDITVNISKLMDMLDGARRGLGLINKLKNREEKLWHLHNVFKNINKIRSAIQQLAKIL